MFKNLKNVFEINRPLILYKTQLLQLQKLSKLF